jgi:transcription antitermination factor NusG
VNNYYWYAIYVKSRTEKKALQLLLEKGIETYLPLQKKLRQWSDRKKWIEVPLMSGYLFVKTGIKEYDSVLKTDYVVCYITFEGKAAIIRDEAIESLKTMMNQHDFEVEVTTEKLKPGRKVEIIAGPMLGMRGELVENRGKNSVCVRIEPLGQTILVNAPTQQLALLPDPQNPKTSNASTPKAKRP